MTMTGGVVRAVYEEDEVWLMNLSIWKGCNPRSQDIVRAVGWLSLSASSEHPLCCVSSECETNTFEPKTRFQIPLLGLPDDFRTEQKRKERGVGK